jgi:hypothetical protein
MNIINENKGIIIGLIAVFVVSVSYGYWSGYTVSSPNEVSNQTSTEAVSNSPEAETLGEIVVIAAEANNEANNTEEDNEAIVAVQVNEAINQAEGTDGLPNE